MEEGIKFTPADKYIINPVNSFISKSTTGGIVLFVSALIAIILANSSFSEWYHHLWEHKIGFYFDGNTYLNYSIHHWVNDGLMAIFFFVVGLELKRELIGGELSNPKNAMLPIIAALPSGSVAALVGVAPQIRSFQCRSSVKVLIPWAGVEATGRGSSGGRDAQEASAGACLVELAVGRRGGAELCRATPAAAGRCGPCQRARRP